MKLDFETHKQKLPRIQIPSQKRVLHWINSDLKVCICKNIAIILHFILYAVTWEYSFILASWDLSQKF